MAKILTGDRPTGPLHLGHLVGSLRERVRLQTIHDQTILIADMQGLTDNASNPKKVSENVLNVMCDYLAVGINPEMSSICLQSQISALAELTMFYSNLVTVSRLERNPTVKSEINDKTFGRSLPVGFLSYPVSQAADITAFKAEIVPVGDDQLPMIEQTNEIVRKLNSIVGYDLLVECKATLSSIPRLPSIDGKNKMSKSMGNCIEIGSSEKQISDAVKQMYTDSKHLKITDPGEIDGNVVFTYLDAFHSDKKMVASLKDQYKGGGLGDSKVKSILNDCLQDIIKPYREERIKLSKERQYLLDILRKGTECAREDTQKTLDQIKSAFGLIIF